MERTIPFYNMILRCDRYEMRRTDLPDGYGIVPYRDGFEADWARLECAAGDFSDEAEAARYFMERYPGRGDREDILFLLDGRGRVMGSCIAWADERQGSDVNSLHWLIVDERCRGNGLGRALCCEAMNRFYLRNRRAVYLHTQPWSWKAILLYCSLGFRLQKTDTFAGYPNEYRDGMRTLRGILSAEQYRLLTPED